MEENKSIKPGTKVLLNFDGAVKTAEFGWHKILSDEDKAQFGTIENFTKEFCTGVVVEPEDPFNELDSLTRGFAKAFLRKDPRETAWVEIKALKKVYSGESNYLPVPIEHLIIIDDDGSENE